MRQVINKLISEDDLFGAVESAYSQGWRRMKLYFLIGLPTETDEDTLGIATLARKVVEIGRRHHKNPSVTISVGGFVPKPFTPVPVVRPEHHGGAGPQGRPAPRRAAPRPGRGPQVARPQGHHRRGDHGPGRPPPGPGHRGRVAPRWHLPGVERALRPPALARRPGAPRPHRRGAGLPPPHRGRGPALGPPLGRAAQGLPLAGLARRPRRGRPRGLPLDALLRLRGLHRLRRRARGRQRGAARRGQPGHRPPRGGARSPSAPDPRSGVA